MISRNGSGLDVDINRLFNIRKLMNEVWYKKINECMNWMNLI